MWECEQADALDWLRKHPARSCALVLFSPPYEKARTYGVGFKLAGQAWVDWLRPIVAESARVSSGLVVVNAAGQVRDSSYSPVMEWLVADLTRVDGLACGPSPYAWVRNGIPGSGGPYYHKRNWEPIYCFALPDRLPLAWTDNTAFGTTPKYAPGGEMSYRQANGVRRNAFGISDTTTCRRQGSGELELQKVGKPHTKRRADGELYHDANGYLPPAVANPGNVIRTGNGGNQTGHPLSHHNEAPMNLVVAERFVCWFAPPDSIVCDPFSGSGTTAHAAVSHGRRFRGCDIRQSQVDLVRRRLRGVTPGLFA